MTHDHATPIAFLLTPETADGWREGPDLAEAGAGQRWSGQRHAAGPTAMPEGPVRELLLVEGAAARNVAAPPGHMVWQGTGIGPDPYPAPEGCGGLMALFMDIPPSHEEEFNAWYALEHLPAVNALPGVVIARRFRAADDAATPRYLTLFHLIDRGSAQHGDFGKNSRAPWSQRIWPMTFNRQRFLFQPAWR